MINKKKDEDFENFSMDDFLGRGSEHSQSAEITKEEEPSITNEADVSNLESKSNRRSVPIKQRKLDLQEYKERFLSVPRITDRKTVFISNDIREQIVSIVRKLGEEKSSVSGFIENLVIHHLESYREDVEKWIKL